MQGIGYRIDIASPPGYEELIALILINGEEVALVQKEEGKDKVIVEFLVSLSTLKSTMMSSWKPYKQLKKSCCASKKYCPIWR